MTALPPPWPHVPLAEKIAWADEYDAWDDFCDHECFDNCDENVSEGGYYCLHQHCWNCGQCGCPGYCDDYQTYNLRPAETGGAENFTESLLSDG